MNNLKYNVKQMLDNYNQNGVISESLLERVQIAYDAEEMQEKMDAVTQSGRAHLEEIIQHMRQFGITFDEACEVESIMTTAQHADCED